VQPSRGTASERFVINSANTTESEREVHLVRVFQRHQRWRARHTLSNELNRGKSARARFPRDDEFITDGVKRRRRSISNPPSPGNAYSLPRSLLLTPVCKAAHKYVSSL